MKRLLTPFYLFFLLANGAFAQNECPRIYKVADTLKTDPAPTYQWYKNGALIPNADKIWYRPTASGDYTVAVGGTSTIYNFDANPADLRVEVFDAKLKPVSNATITVNGQTTTTDANGNAFLSAVVSGRAVIKVTQNGFFDGYSSVYKPATGATIVKIQLEKFPSPLTIQDTASATVAAPSGLSLKFPANAFKVESSGEPYNGEVKIYFNHRAPENDPLFSFAMPGGDFTAIDANGATVALTSYGFFNAELRGGAGEKLNLQSGVTADVQFRIPEKMRAAAPATVPLWSFDEAAGIWKYDSELIKTGIFYKGKVSHFSSWNCDYAGPRCTVEASAKDCNGNPAPGAIIYLNESYGVTNDLGKATFINAPADMPIRLSTQRDSVMTPPVGDGATFILAEPLLANKNFLAMAQYWTDSVQAWVFGAEPPVQYSLNGQNWQTEPLFTAVPLQDSVIVWIKDASGCPITQTAFYSRQKEKNVCRTAQTQADIDMYNTTFQNLSQWSLPILCVLNNDFGDVSHALLLEAVEKYPCLTIVNISGGGLTALPSEIEKWSVLLQLTLQSNQLSELPSEIGNLSALMGLDISYNHFANLLPEIGNLSSLIQLNVTANQLMSLPSEIGNLTALTDLDLNENQLASLPAEIGNLSGLTSLNLNQNQLSVLPAQIGNLANLTFLGLSNNQLTSVPPEIGNLTALSNLYLSDNQLTSVPSEIGNLTALSNLYLSDNQLTAVPAEIGNLNVLTWLDLQTNQITALPPEIGNLSALKWLDLSGNLLTSLPSEIANLADTLQHLSLHGTPIPAQDRPYYQSLLPDTTIAW